MICCLRRRKNRAKFRSNNYLKQPSNIAVINPQPTFNGNQYRPELYPSQAIMNPPYPSSASSFYRPNNSINPSLYSYQNYSSNMPNTNNSQTPSAPIILPYPEPNPTLNNQQSNINLSLPAYPATSTTGSHLPLSLNYSDSLPPYSKLVLANQ